MKFKGHGILWDADNNCPLCRFENGEFETEEPRTIQILERSGYEGEESEESAKDVDLNTLTVEALKALLDEKGITYDAKLKKAELVEILVNSHNEGAE